jgi:hypothetical protein
MSDMKPVRRRSGNQHLHRASPEYRAAVRRKLHASERVNDFDTAGFGI